MQKISAPFSGFTFLLQKSQAGSTAGSVDTSYLTVLMLSSMTVSLKFIQKCKQNGFLKQPKVLSHMAKVRSFSFFFPEEDVHLINPKLYVYTLSRKLKNCYCIIRNFLNSRFFRIVIHSRI